MSKVDARRGMTRRQLIRAAAATGAAAWTAPIIIGSVASPALGATASQPCVCGTPGHPYRGAKIEGLGGCSSTSVNGSAGFTGAGGEGGSNACAARNRKAVHGAGNLDISSCGTCGTAAARCPTYNCTTHTVTLPAGATFGAFGLVAVFGGSDCTGDFFVENPVPAGYGSANPHAGALLANQTSMVLPADLLGDLSHVNIVYCCC